MIQANVKIFDRFPEITARVEQLAREAVDAAAAEAARVAQAGSSHNLEIEVIHERAVFEGFSAGIKARKHGVTSRDGKERNVPLGNFFDAGTLAGRTRPLKGHDRRKKQWQVQRAGRTFTEARHDAKGIRAENFFTKARTAGRRRLLQVLKTGR